MAESVDALVSNTSGATRAGSTPALGTESEFCIKTPILLFLLRVTYWFLGKLGQALRCNFWFDIFSVKLNFAKNHRTKELLAKSEHSHPVWNVGIHPFSHENDHGKALKNGAYPFKSAKIAPKI